MSDRAGARLPGREPVAGRGARLLLRTPGRYGDCGFLTRLEVYHARATTSELNERAGGGPGTTPARVVS